MAFSGSTVRGTLLVIAVLTAASSAQAAVLTPVEIPPDSGRFSCTCEGGRRPDGTPTYTPCGNGGMGSGGGFTQPDIPTDMLKWYLPDAGQRNTLIATGTPTYSRQTGWNCQRAR